MIKKQEIKLKGIIINQENLCDLLSKIEQYYKKYNIVIKLTDGSSLEKMTITELKDYNFSNRKIQDIDIGFCDENEAFDEFRLEKPIDSDYRIIFSHDKEDIYAIVKEIIENWIIQNKSMKITKFVHSNLFVILTTLLFIIPIMFILISETPSLIVYLFACALLMSLSSLICYGLWYLAKFLCPLVEIDIGINKNKKYRKSLSWIFSVIIIPTILAIILEFIL